MKRMLSNAAASVTNQVKEAAADPLAVMAANPVRSFVQRRSADPGLAALNGFLRFELVAADALRELIARLEVHPFQGELGQVLAAHERRALRLAEECGRRGAPARSDEWRVRLRVMLARLAARIGEERAINLMHAREQLALRVYRGAHAQLDEAARRILVDELLPDQERTAEVIAGLARKL